MSSKLCPTIYCGITCPLSPRRHTPRRWGSSPARRRCAQMWSPPRCWTLTWSKIRLERWLNFTTDLLILFSYTSAPMTRELTCFCLLSLGMSQDFWPLMMHPRFSNDFKTTFVSLTSSWIFRDIAVQSSTSWIFESLNLLTSILNQGWIFSQKN